MSFPISITLNINIIYNSLSLLSRIYIKRNMTQQSLKMKARVYLTYFKDIRLSVKMKDINLNNSQKDELCMYILHREKKIIRSA